MFNIADYIPSVVVIFISLIFRNHIFTEIGGNGFSVPAARVNKVKWMYAQAIGPKILLKIGISVFAFSVIYNICARFFEPLQNIASFMPWITLVLALGGLIVVNKEVDAFSPEWLSDDEKCDDWVEKAIGYANNKQYKELYEFVKNTKTNKH
jgi:hypothetical protein